MPGMSFDRATAADAVARPGAVVAVLLGDPVGGGGGAFGFRSASIVSSACWNFNFDCRSETRSCGRLGPARLGSTVERSSSSVVV